MPINSNGRPPSEKVAVIRELIGALDLTAVRFEDYLLILKVKFDMTIAGEPHHARTLLFNLKSGRFLSRIWGKTVSNGFALRLEELRDECARHFEGGKNCRGVLSKQQLNEQNAPLDGEPRPCSQHDANKESGVMYIANQAVYWQEIADKYPHIMKAGKPFKIKIKTEDSKGCLQEKFLLVDPTQTLQQGGVVETLSENDFKQTERGNLKQYVKIETEESNSFSNHVKKEKSSEDEQTPNTVSPSLSPNEPSKKLKVQSDMATPSTSKTDHELLFKAECDPFYQIDTVKFDGSRVHFGKMPTEFDNELLAKLFRDSDILKCKTNQVKRDKWKKIAEDYCTEKDIALIDHKKLARKWGRLVKVAQKKRSKAKKDQKVKEEGGPSNCILLDSAESGTEPFAEHDEDNKTQMTAKKEQCQFCEKAFDRINALNRHVNETHYENIFRCPVCYHRASNVEKLIAHMEQNNHNNGNPFIKCPKCLLQFDLAAIQSHYGKCLKPESVTIPIESHFIFASMSLASSSDIDMPATSSNNVTLDGTRGITETQLEFKDHYDSKLNQFICPYCNEGFKSALLLSHHKRLTHLWGRFSCPECDTIFSLLKDLLKHMYDANHDRNPLIRCGSGFGGTDQYGGGDGCKRRMDIEYLPKHYVKCVAKKIKKKDPFTKGLRQCEVCGKVCTDERGYKYHSLTHTGERNFQCDRCPKRCMTKTLLKYHIKHAHEGIYDPQHCSICGETFKFHDSLKKHQYRTHGVGDMKLCPHCGFKSLTSTGLKQHMLCHKEATLQCSYCEKMFKRKESLKIHEREHTGEKPFTCSICGAGFRSASGLGQHKSCVHKIPRGRALRAQVESKEGR